MVKATGMLCYVFAASIAGYACWNLFISDSIFPLGIGKILLISVLVAVPILIGTVMIVSSEKSLHEKYVAVRRIMIASFLLYCGVLCYILSAVGKWNFVHGGMTSHHYLQFGISFFSLNTLGSYFDRVIDYSGNVFMVVQAVFSGLIGFMPMGIFLPCICPKLRNWKAFIFSMILILLVIESAQVFLKPGTFDIADIILHLLGALIIFSIVRLEEVQSALSKVYLIESGNLI